MECAARGRGGPCAPGPPTRRCGVCGAVAYCSPSHQMLHWNEHKEECARLEEQMKHADFLNDFPFTFSMEATRSVTRCSFLMSKGLHQIGLWKSECSCKPTVVSTNYSWIVDDWKLPSSLCPCTEPKSPLSTCLRGWKDYYEWRCLPFHSPVALLLHWPLTIYHCCQLLAVRSLNSEVGNRLCIHYLGPEKEIWQLAVFGELQALFPGVQLQIELVGPAVPQFMDGMTLNLCNYVNCSEESCPCRSSCIDSGSGGPNGQTSKVLLKLHKGFYHDRYIDIIKGLIVDVVYKPRVLYKLVSSDARSFTRAQGKEQYFPFSYVKIEELHISCTDSYPQLIVAPNAGVAAYANWLPTIKLIQEMGVPAVFSDFCEEAAYLGARCISTMTCQPLKLPIQTNPFRQPMEVDDSALYLPCYSNCFLFGI